MTSNSKSGSAWRTIDAVKTSCRVLEALHRLGRSGVTELADELDVSVSCVHSHLATLEESELVVKDGSTYRLGLRLLDFGENVKQNLEFYDVVQAEAEALAERSGEVVHVMIEEHGWGRYICKVAGSSDIQTGTYVGKRQHLHCSGNGKAILSALSDDRVETIIDEKGLVKHTENTITTKAELFEELETIRDRGVAFHDEEYMEGIRSVGAPISTQEHGLLGGISTVGPTSRLSGARFREELPGLLLNSANIIQINAAQL